MAMMILFNVSHFSFIHFFPVPFTANIEGDISVSISRAEAIEAVKYSALKQEFPYKSVYNTRLRVTCL